MPSPVPCGFGKSMGKPSPSSSTVSSTALSDRSSFTLTVPRPYLSALVTSSAVTSPDRKSTRLNSSHTVIYTLSLHDALPIFLHGQQHGIVGSFQLHAHRPAPVLERVGHEFRCHQPRSEEHTSELQSHSDLHSFPTRRSSDLPPRSAARHCRIVPASRSPSRART